MSQEKLGEAFGISFQQVQKYEKGVNRISARSSRRSRGIRWGQAPVFGSGRGLARATTTRAAQTSDRAPIAVPKVGACPSGFVQSGAYCVDARKR
jgi:hypothetical protein